jgi:hypothetical protein
MRAIVPLISAAGSRPPGVIGGGLMLAGTEGGLYWNAGGIIASFVATRLNGRVLLIGLLR